MVTKCANPGCTHRFSYGSKGKLYLFGRHTLEQSFWLCEQCAPAFEVVLDGERRPVLASRSAGGKRNVVSMPAPSAGREKAQDFIAMDAAIREQTFLEWTLAWLEDWERQHETWVPAEAAEGGSRVMEWSAGAICRRTGVHTVIHHQHRPAHQVIVWQGEKFPACRKCGTRVSFEFVQPLEDSAEVEHIGYDRDFLESIWGLAPGAA